MDKTGRSKTAKRNRIKDLPPKDTKQVKAGGKITHNELSVTKLTDKASP